jgi:hypothetical protein
MQNLSISYATRAQPRPNTFTFVATSSRTSRPAKPKPAGLTRAQLREIIIEQLG